MRGSPLLRAAIAFFILLSLGWPLWQMTHGEDAERAPEPVAAPAGPKEIHVQLTFTRAPESVKVSHLGKEILRESAPAEEIERDLKLAYPDEGVDLRFEIEWPAGASLAAMRVKLTDPSGEDHEKGVWAKGPADEVLTFP